MSVEDVIARLLSLLSDRERRQELQDLQRTDSDLYVAVKEAMMRLNIKGI